MSLTTDLRRSLKTFERETRHPVLVWKGANYPCVVSMLHRGNTLTVGGFEAMVHYTLLVRKDVMPEPLTADSDVVTVDSVNFTADQDAPPATGARVQVRMPTNLRTYRVLEVREPSAGSHWEFDLGTVNK